MPLQEKEGRERWKEVVESAGILRSPQRGVCAVVFSLKTYMCTYLSQRASRIVNKLVGVVIT